MKVLQRLHLNLLKVPRYMETLPCHWIQTKSTTEVKPIKMAYNSYQSTGLDETQAPLIIMHGLFGSKGNWNSLCKAYQKTLNCKVYSVDARNHGESPHTPEHSYEHIAADLHQFMQDFHIKKAKFIGHSMGGRAVMYFTLKHPRLVEKLVVVDIAPHRTSPSVDSMPPLFEFMAKVHMPQGGTMAEARQHVDRQLATKINDRSLRAFLVTNLVQKSDGSHAWRINLTALLTNFRKNIAIFPQMPELTYDGPTLFVGGEKSDHIPKNSLSVIQRLFPRVELKFIKDAGHWVHSEKPHEFLKITAEFLKQDVLPQAEATAAKVQPAK